MTVEIPEVTLDTLDGVPEALHGLFAENGDGYKLTGLAPKGKLDEFRTNNRELHKKADELETKLKDFEGIDPEKARSAAEELQKLRDKMEAGEHGIADEKLQELLDKRTERMRDDHETHLAAKDKKIAELEKQLEATNTSLAERVIDSEVAQATAGDAFVPEAITDATMQAHRVFKVEGGKAVARDDDGKLVYGADGEKPLTIKEWVTSTRKTKPHWWRANADGSGKGSGSGEHGDKVMKRAAFDALDPAARDKFIASDGKIVD